MSKAQFFIWYLPWRCLRLFGPFTMKLLGPFSLSATIALFSAVNSDAQKLRSYNKPIFCAARNFSRWLLRPFKAPLMQNVNISHILKKTR